MMNLKWRTFLRIWWWAHIKGEIDHREKIYGHDPSTCWWNMMKYGELTWSQPPLTVYIYYIYIIYYLYIIYIIILYILLYWYFLSLSWRYLPYISIYKVCVRGCIPKKYFFLWYSSSILRTVPEMAIDISCN